MLARLIFVFLLCAGASTASAQPAALPDPDLGERLVEGFATSDTLWVRAANGALVRFDRVSGERHVVATAGVVDILRVDGRTVALRKAAGPSSRYEIIDGDTGLSLLSATPHVQSASASIVRVGDRWGVLTDRALMVHNGGRWRSTGLVADAQASFGANSVFVADHTIYVGRNRGEWGGGVRMVDARSGRVREVQRRDSDRLCAGPLNSDCDPVTGLAMDVANTQCVLAAVGLSHMFTSRGRILRVCGSQVDVVFDQEIPDAPGERIPSKSHWPFFGIAATKTGWVAVSSGVVFRSVSGQVTQEPLPSLETWHGLEAAFLDDVVILETDLNAGMSTSGYTPLLAPIID